LIVLDASATVEFLLGSDLGERVGPALEQAGAVHAPALLDVEVAQVIRRLERAETLESTHAAALIEILQETPVTRHPIQPLLPRIWQWRANLTAYDACYVALAEALSCSILTTDQRLISAADGAVGFVEV